MNRKDEEFLKRLLATFKVEAQEHLKVISSGLIEMEKGDAGKKPELIETVYREAHSLKGAARSVNLPHIVAICQSMENVFSLLNRKKLVLSTQMLDLLHHTVDFTRRLSAGEELSSSEKKGMRELIDKLDEAGVRDQGTWDMEQEAQVRDQEPEIREQRTDVRSPARSLQYDPGTVHISVSKLDSLLLRAEEMLSVKLAAGQRTHELKELKKVFEQWKKKGPRTPDPFFATFEASLTNLIKSAENDQRSTGIMIDTLLDDAKKTLMLPFSSLLEPFPVLVRNLAHDASKEVELTQSGSDIEVDRRILEEIKDPLTHLVRNCIDHGIETPYVRQKKKKPSRGNISISISSVDGKIEIAMSDDGAGIDTSKLKKAAVDQGFIQQEEAARLSEQEALLLIFRSGVTTSPLITDISGRGLGLAIVREKVEKLNGSITVDTQPDAGTTFRMTVPLTLATFRGVLVRASDQLFILPSANMERVATVKKEDIQTIENCETITLDGRPVSVVRLGDVLEPAGVRPSGSDTSVLLIVLLRSAEKRMAFVTDEILHEQEVLVKPLGRQLSRVRNITGAAVLGNGRVVPILNIADLMKSAVKSGPVSVRAVETEPEKKLSVLVAEDSITARTLLKNILESAGYVVETAVDGIEAFTELKAREFDLLVSDVDMPRMNGFDLTAKVRADKKLWQLPVVLVTALESREDKERGIDAGADAYIVKSSFDQSNLLEVIRRLI